MDPFSCRKRVQRYILQKHRPNLSASFLRKSPKFNTAAGGKDTHTLLYMHARNHARDEWAICMGNGRLTAHEARAEGKREGQGGGCMGHGRAGHDPRANHYRGVRHEREKVVQLLRKVVQLFKKVVQLLQRRRASFPIEQDYASVAGRFNGREWFGVLGRQCSSCLEWRGDPSACRCREGEYWSHRSGSRFPPWMK